MKDSQSTKKAGTVFKSLDLLLTKDILDYLPLEDINSFARVNRSCNQTYKVYIILRISVENNRIKAIEQDEDETIQRIQQKREEFCEHYEIDLPDREKAIGLLTDISPKVIIIPT